MKFVITAQSLLDTQILEHAYLPNISDVDFSWFPDQCAVMDPPFKGLFTGLNFQV